MNILGHMEASIGDFRPRTAQEFVALQLARRFNDLHRLPRYLLAAQRHTKRTLLQAARTARLRHELNRQPLCELFFEIIAEVEKGANQ